MKADKFTPDAEGGLLPRLVRRSRHSRRLDFKPAIPCRCGKDMLTVIDHRAPWYASSASRELRYEVTCDTCLQCDADGYQNRAEVLEAYSENA